MSFLNRVFKGDFKGAFQPTKTVAVEMNPYDASRRVLRFGKGEDDWFPAAGEQADLSDLAEILSKAIESPSLLKKIRNMPVGDRPTLRLIHGMRGCGSCNGESIMISAGEGTGYDAAATFAHEFQHQCQFKHDGVGKYKKGLSLAEDILDDRIVESAAETAGYQYRFEVRGKNPQARAAFVKAMTQGVYAAGMRAYYAAKKSGKSEGDCVLAGMTGYASNFRLARGYECDYHREIAAPPMFLEPERYRAELREGRKKEAVKFVDACLSGKKLDVAAAFRSHTVGMTDEKMSDERIRERLRSPRFAFVSSTTMRMLNMCRRAYRKITGRDHPTAGESLNVRNAYGVFDSAKAGGAAWAAYQAGNVKASVEKAIQDALYPKAGKIGAHHYFCADGREMFSFDGTEKNPNYFTGAVFFRPDARYADSRKSPLAPVVLDRHADAAEKMLSILVKDGDFKKKLMNCGASMPVAFGFDLFGNVGEGQLEKDSKTDVIVLNPSRTPRELANDFKRNFEVLTERRNRERNAAFQTAAQTNAGSNAGVEKGASLMARLTERAPNRSTAENGKGKTPPASVASKISKTR